jgi:hypothetical protein
MNAAKTEVKVMIPGPIHIGLTSPAYRHRMTGEGGTAQERWAFKVSCPHCQIEIQALSMQRHLVAMHQTYIRTPNPLLLRLFVTPDTYNLSVPQGTIQTDCPVLGCDGRATRRDDMRTHFM